MALLRSVLGASVLLIGWWRGIWPGRLPYEWLYARILEGKPILFVPLLRLELWKTFQARHHDEDLVADVLLEI